MKKIVAQDLWVVWLENVGEACSEVGGTESRVVGLDWGQVVADSQEEAASSQDTGHTSSLGLRAGDQQAGQGASDGMPSHTVTLRV